MIFLQIENQLLDFWKLNLHNQALCSRTIKYKSTLVAIIQVTDIYLGLCPAALQLFTLVSLYTLTLLHFTPCKSSPVSLCTISSTLATILILGGGEWVGYCFKEAYNPENEFFYFSLFFVE